MFSKNISILIYKNDSISTYLKTLSFVISFLYIDIVIDSILKGLDKQVPVMIINVIDLVVSICFIYFFVPILGVTGYVVSIFLSEVLNFVLSALVLYNAFKTNYNSINSSWFPCSIMFPSFITKIRSAFFIVESLCAIINDVLPSVNLSIAI